MLPLPAWATTLLLLSIVLLLLYLSREVIHKAIYELFHLLYAWCRIVSRSLSAAEKKLRARNREVLLSLGQEQVERELQREFFRINRFVAQDLGGYPQLQRDIEAQMVHIDEDYRHSQEVPLPSPEWVDAVSSVAKLPLNEQAGPMQARILEEIHVSAQEQQQDAINAYRQSMAERHGILKKMVPYWRQLGEQLDKVGKYLNELNVRAANIDKQMELYDKIKEGSSQAEHTLKVSAATQFTISLLVMAIASAGAFFNFHLIALPMSEMVGAASKIGGVAVSDLSALVIIFLEITMGIFLLECLRITRLFPIIGSMDDKMRQKLVWIFAFFLLSLACIEAGLAYMRDQIAYDLLVLKSSLIGSEVAPQNSIPLITNMAMGFILPLVLTVVGIPLEYLIQTGRTVIGVMLEWLLRVLCVCVRTLGLTGKHVGQLCIYAYDLLIILPLSIEKRLQQRQAVKSAVMNGKAEAFVAEAEEAA